MPPVVVSRSNATRTLTLNRPERKNALDNDGWRALLEALRSAAASEDRVVVVTGAGGDFCAGADLADVETLHPLERMGLINEVALALHRLPQPSIAKVDGVAVGAGCNLAFGCDLVVASDRARFSEIFSRRGLSLDLAGSWLLARRVGLHRAKELAFFADLLGSAEAERLGLVNRVVPAGELDGAVEEWSERLAAGPPLALRLTKRLLDSAFDHSFESALDAEAAAQTVNLTSKDGREAIAAFLERREPRYEGR